MSSPKQRTRRARRSSTIVRRGFEIESKHDTSPVTEADRAAELIILAALARAAPGVPVIAEEEVAAGRIPAHDDLYFLVDPLDGTKEFVRGGDDYTVNIGLIERGAPTPRRGVRAGDRPAARRSCRRGGLARRGWRAAGASAHATADRRSPPLHPNRTSTRRRSIISRWQSAPALMCRSARRLNSASSPKAKPTFTRARHRPASGTQPRAMRSCSRLGDWLTVPTARRWVTASTPFSTGPSSRPAVGKRRGSTHSSNHFPVVAISPKAFKRSVPATLDPTAGARSKSGSTFPDGSLVRLRRSDWTCA